MHVRMCVAAFRHKNHSELGCRNGVHHEKNYGNKYMYMYIQYIYTCTLYVHVHI